MISRMIRTAHSARGSVISSSAYVELRRPFEDLKVAGMCPRTKRKDATADCHHGLLAVGRFPKPGARSSSRHSHRTRAHAANSVLPVTFVHLMLDRPIEDHFVSSYEFRRHSPLPGADTRLERSPVMLERSLRNSADSVWGSHLSLLVPMRTTVKQPRRMVSGGESSTECDPAAPLFVAPA